MFQTSNETNLLDAALAKAQGEIENAVKNSTNPHFRSKYANLEGVIDASKESLAKHEINLTQWVIHSSDNMVHMVTRLAHKGQFMQATSSIPVVKQDPQGYGSAISYLRRYAMMAALGMASEDDDGNQAVASKPKPLAERVQAKPAEVVQQVKTENKVKYNNMAPGSIAPSQMKAILDFCTKNKLDVNVFTVRELKLYSQIEANALWDTLNGHVKTVRGSES